MTGMQVVNKGTGKGFEMMTQQLRQLHAKFNPQTRTWDIPAEMVAIAQAKPCWGKGIVPVAQALASRPSHADLSHDADALYADGIDDPRYWAQR